MYISILYANASIVYKPCSFFWGNLFPANQLSSLKWEREANGDSQLDLSWLAVVSWVSDIFRINLFSYHLSRN
jgi:hypothetical protein